MPGSREACYGPGESPAVQEAARALRNVPGELATQQMRLNVAPIAAAAANFSGLPKSSGAIRPAVKEKSSMKMNVWNDAARPRTSGNISSAIMVIAGVAAAAAN